MPLESFTKSVTIAEKFTPQSGSNLIPIYQPSVANAWDRIASNRFNGFITDLRLKVDIQSVPEAGLPDLDVMTSRADRLVAIRDNEWRNPRKQIDFYLKKTGKPELHLGSVSLLNRRPYYQVPLLGYLTDSGIFALGNDGVLYAKITDVGYGVLLGPDNVSLWGSAKEEATILPAAAEQITYSQSFNWNIGTQAAMILPANPSRKQLTLTNAGSNRIWIGYGPTIQALNGITLMPGGGSYEINLSNPYKGAIAAVSENSGSILTGLEGV